MLYNFLVLGYIPGTNIQLSFQAVLALLVVFAGVASISWIELHRRRPGLASTIGRQLLPSNRQPQRAR